MGGQVWHAFEVGMPCMSPIFVTSEGSNECLCGELVGFFVGRAEGTSSDGALVVAPSTAVGISVG